MISLMENALTEEDMRFIGGLEGKFDINDDLYAIMNDIKLFFFKKGLKTGINIIKYCDK